MYDAYIVGAVRTAVGSLGGFLATKTPVELSTAVIKELQTRVAAEDIGLKIEEVLLGNVLAAGAGQNIARQAAVLGGLGWDVPATTINFVCGSGLKSVMLAAQSIALGTNDAVIAGGVESMSRAPYLLDKAREGYRLGHAQLTDSLINDGLWCTFEDTHMGVTAELIAEEYGIERSAQDEYAYQSHQRAIAAIDSGSFSEEIVPLQINSRKSIVTFDTDEHPRRDTTLDKLSRLRPAFKRDGTITAGNASGINDGAGVVLVMSERKVKELNFTPMARIVGYAVSATEAKYMGIAPIDACKKVIKKTGLALDSIGLFEINEAFAATTIAVIKTLGLSTDIVNINGGAIALGHPIGASGTRILVTLLYNLKRTKKKYGMAMLCVGGGMAAAMVIENLML